MKSRMKQKVRAAVIIAWSTCIMAMPGECCVGTAGSVHMSISSQSSVHAACALAGVGMTPKRGHSVAGLSVLARRVIKKGVAVAVVDLRENMKLGIEADEVAIIISAKHEELVELLKPERLKCLKHWRTRAAAVAAAALSLTKQTPLMQSPGYRLDSKA
eukprot:6181182-Pleurochrysis_carterae.AAC.1